nr:MAG TPA: hypothetical protein [Caudoviricetes sp.]
MDQQGIAGQRGNGSNLVKHEERPLFVTSISRCCKNTKGNL